jgi:hypothetical protein
MGRPPLGLKTILVRLAPSMIDRIRKINKNFSAFVREAVEIHVEKSEKKAKKPKD